jgi:cellobiose transport system permease protein
MVFVIITATIGGLQIFTEPRLFDPVAAGGTGRQFQTTVLYLWEMAFQRQNFGKAATIAWLLFLIILLFGLANYLITRRIASAGERGTRRPRTLRPARGSRSATVKGGNR